MSNFKGPYLRILEPRTTNGVNLKYDDDGNVMYNEQHAPLTARKEFEKRNAQLPKHLRLIIETVGVDNPEAFEKRPQRIPRANPQPGKVTPAKPTSAKNKNSVLE